MIWTAGRRGIPGVDLSGLRHELPALLAFVWQTTGRRERWALLCAAAVAVGVGIGVPLAVATFLPPDPEVRQTVLVVLPAAWAFFAVSILISALASSGGRELLPRNQLPGFPLSPATDHAAALLTIPLNVAWTLQSVSLLTAVAVITAGAPGLLVQATVMTTLWILAASCLAQFAGWAAELLRSTRHGDTVLRGLALAAVAVGAAVVLSGHARTVLDSLPTTSFVIAAVVVDDPARFAVAGVGLLVVAVVSFLGAIPLVAALSRRSVPQVAAQDTRLRPRRSSTGSELGWLIGLDQRMVLRSAPLRRGLAVLTVLPLLAALLVPLPWTALTILPALVASASGLLYGVNAFALDGGGAVWRNSLPQPAAQWLDARLIVLVQVCGGGAIVVVGAAALRAGQAPSAAELAAVVCAAITAVLQVISRCARWSIRRPFPAVLRSSRDAPAPPVSLAGYAVALSVATTLSATLFALAGSTGAVALPVAILLLFLISGTWSLRRAATAFESPAVRARVTATVAGT